MIFLSCVLCWWPNLLNFTSLSSPSLAVTGLGAPLSSSVLKRRYVSLMNEWMNEWMNEQISVFNFQTVTDTVWITDIVWMDDHKLLQELNLTARQPCRAPIMLHILFNKRRHLASEGLVNLTGMWGVNSGLPAPHAKMLSTTLTLMFLKLFSW